jgi:two-component system, OmpR family, phosphate regulon sensor histidine kinase PhoR
MDIWLLILIIFLASVVILYLAVRILGYRLTRRKVRKASQELALSDLNSLAAVPVVSQTTAKAAIQALSEIHDGVLIIGPGYHVQYINDAASNIFGLSRDRKSGLTFIEVVRDHECDALLRKCMETNQVQVSLIKTHLKRQLLKVMAAPAKETNNYIVIVRDLTETQKIEQIRRDLVSNIAHEFRTPITSIKLLAEALLQGAANDPKVSADFLRKIDVESGKLEQMTNDLNELSRIETGGLKMERGTADIGRLVHQTVDRLKAQAERKRIAIGISVEPGMPHPVIDRSGIESVLVNLIHNAIKYTDSGGRITVGAAKDGDKILISVADTGSGIPKDELARIFERFYKVDKSRNTEGSGLGLAISKHIIVAHGGRIWVDSTEGKGAIFYFTLPLTL